MAQSGADELVFAPLGGLGEIGMNAALYGFGPEGRKKWILVDCGISFAGDELPGVEIILPDLTLLSSGAKTCWALSLRTRMKTI